MNSRIGRSSEVGTVTPSIENRRWRGLELKVGSRRIRSQSAQRGADELVELRDGEDRCRLPDLAVDRVRVGPVVRFDQPARPSPARPGRPTGPIVPTARTVATDFGTANGRKYPAPS